MSLPITTRWRWLPRWKDRPAAMPTFMAISAVIGNLLACAANAVRAEILRRHASTPLDSRVVRSRVFATELAAHQRITFGECMLRTCQKSLFGRLRCRSLIRKADASTSGNRKTPRIARTIRGAFSSASSDTSRSALRLRLHAAFGLAAALLALAPVAPAFGTAEPRRRRRVVADVARRLLAGDQLLDLVARQRLVFEQAFGDARSTPSSSWSGSCVASV